MSTTNTAEDFDFAEWFGDAGVPEESIDVFTRADLVGEISALQRTIQENDQVDLVEEKSLGDEMSPEEERLAELLQLFADSKRTFYIRGLSGGQLKTIRKQHETSGRDATDFVERCLSASIVGLRRPGGDRTKVTLNLSNIQKLHTQLGDGQFAEMFKTYQQATSGVPVVDADFLHRRSGQDAGAE